MIAKENESQVLTQYSCEEKCDATLFVKNTREGTWGLGFICFRRHKNKENRATSSMSVLGVRRLSVFPARSASGAQPPASVDVRK